MIKHPHHCHHTTHYRTNTSKKCHPTFLILLFNHHMEWRHLVEEKDTWKPTAGSGINMSKMLCNTVLIRLNCCAVQVTILRRDHLNIVGDKAV